MMKQIMKGLGVLFCFAMLLGVAPATAHAADTYTKAGEIGAVTAECAPIVPPTLGGEVISHFPVTVTSPTDKGVLNSTGDDVQWQRKTGDTWMNYTEEAFDEGTYRLCISLSSIARSNGNYYALVPTTTLTVNGTLFTPGEAPDDRVYQNYGNGSMDFYSQEYTVTKEAGTYLVTVTAGANGRASADKVYGKSGEVVTLTAEPFTGYRLKEWRVISGGVTVENDQFTIGSEDVEIKAIFESTNEYLGDITQVEVIGEEGVDYRPIMGNTAGRIDVTIRSSTPNDDTLSLAGYGCGMWEVKQPDGRWAHFINERFAGATYRMRISLRNEVADGKYHALTEDTVLIVDGEVWTAEPDSLYTYYSLADGYGMISFVSEEMEAIPALNVFHSTQKGCHVVPTKGEFTVPQGDPFSFTVAPDDYYELTNPNALEVYVNNTLVTPDEDGVYTVSTEDELELDIDVDSDDAFTGYSNLIISANGKTVTEKVYVGDSYTFKTLAEFGAAAPAGSTFTGWKIGGKTYQPGETYPVVGTTDINVNAAFTGLYNVTVENGKAYADAAHTQPITYAAEEQVVYVVADPAPEGKVFSYWSRTFATVGGHGWFGDSESAETTFTVYDSDVVLTPVYETLVDEIVISGLTKPSAGVAVDNSDYSYKWGCSVPANSGYSLGICYWYDTTTGEAVSMNNGDVFQIGHTYRFQARISLYGDTVFPANAEDISVTLNGIDAEDYEWTINEIGYTSVTIYFEFTCQREKPDTSIERPEGSGTAADPFQISTVGELYWFTGFTNNYVAVSEDFAVERNKAHAILMNDIIVNPELLDSYGLNANSSLLADWTPICGSKDSPYCGTFDGQGHAISGLYYNTEGYQHEYYGFIAMMGENGAVKDLTLEDTYFYTEYTGNGTPYAAGIVALAPEASNRIENCHFDGVVGTESSRYGGVAGGITAVIGGKIQDCTAKGRVIGTDSYSGDNGKAGGIAGQAYVTAMISDCTNYAEVTCWDSGTGVGYAGGIAGYLAGTVKDCCNRGVINGYNQGNYNYVGGIIGWARGTAEQSAVISRCFNEASFTGSGIVDYVYCNGTYYEGYVTVKNCYNTGSVTNGIVGTAKGAGISITYCHNVGITTKPIIDSIINADDIEMTNCYYIESSHYDTDRVEMTEAMLAEEFADGTVLALLNNGHWTQGEDDEYPVLGDPPTAISGKVTVTGTSATASVTVEELSDTSVILLVAQYQEGKMTDLRTMTVTADGTFALHAFTHAEGCTYKGFLVQTGTYAPLCSDVKLNAATA